MNSEEEKIDVKLVQFEIPFHLFERLRRYARTQERSLSAQLRYMIARELE